MVRSSTRTALAAAILALAVVPIAWADLPIAKPAAPASPQVGCGTDRWAVKTLADPAGRALTLMPKPSTIRKLSRAKVPPNLGRLRSRGIERTNFRVTAKLVQMKLDDENDISLVVADPKKAGATMIVEFPSPSCTKGAKRKVRAKMARARAAVVAACGAPTNTYGGLTGTATITGVGFFDRDLSQEGAAPNGLELHPVLAFTASSCASAPLPPPPPDNCAASYPTVCIPPPPPRLKCSDIPYRNFVVLWYVPHPDPQHFDKDRNGIGCES